MGKLRIVATLFVLGAVGGLIYLGELALEHAVPEAEAQTAVCGAGRRCNVGSLRSSGNIVTSAGNVQSTYGIWQANNGYQIGWGTPSSAVGLAMSGVNIYTWSTAGGLQSVALYTGGVSSSNTYASTVASGSNAFSAVTGARVDLGSGSNDYLSASDGHAGTAGGFRFNNNSAARPSCDAAARGVVWYVPGGAAQADTFEVCRKDAADAYAWVSLY